MFVGIEILHTIRDKICTYQVKKIFSKKVSKYSIVLRKNNINITNDNAKKHKLCSASIKSRKSYAEEEKFSFIGCFNRI